MKFFEFAIRRPIASTMFFLALILLGIVSLERISLQMLPDIAAPGGGVEFWTTRAMSAEEIERTLIRPIEGAVAELPNVREIHVWSWGQGGFCYIGFEYGANVQQRIVELQAKLNTLRREFPRGSVRLNAFPFETSLFNRELMSVAIKAPEDDPYLERIDTDRIRQRLQDVDGIASGNIWGGRRRSVEVNIMQDRLREFGVPLWNIISTVQTYTNEPVFLGEIHEGGQRCFVRLDGQFQDTSEIEDVVIRSDVGIAVRHLGDVEETQRARRWLRRMDGQPTLSIDLQREAQVNIIELSNRVRDKIAEVSEELPSGYELAIQWDMADEIRDMLSGLTQLALMGVLLSVCVLYLFIRNLRMSLIVCIVIPICIIATFNAMYFANMSINIVSLIGLAVGIGALIDSSIVVLENIFRHNQRRMKPLSAAILGTREVGRAVFAFTITNIVVFLPIIFVQGEIRLIFTEGALAIIFPMVISMLVALTLVPIATAQLLRATGGLRAASFAGKANGGNLPNLQPGGLAKLNPARLLTRFTMGPVYKLYMSALKACLRNRIRFLIAIALVVAYTMYYTMASVHRDIMQEPQDDNSFMIYIYTPAGSKQPYTIGVLEEVERIIQREVPEREATHSWISDDYAQIRVILVPQKERERASRNIQEELRPHFVAIGDAEVTFTQTRTRGQSSTPVMDTGQSGIVEIRGPEFEQINAIAENFAELLQQIPGIRDLTNESEQGAWEVHFHLDRENAALLQITPQLIAQSIQSAQRRGEYGELRMKRGDQEIDIVFSQIPDTGDFIADDEMQGLRMEELRQVPVYSPSLATTVSLGDLGRFELTRGLGSFQRENRERVGRLRFQTVHNINYSEIETQIKELIDVYPAPAGYRLALTGRSERINEALQEVYSMALLAVILVFMCIAALFESFIRPLVVLLALPLASIGIIWMLILTNTPFTEMGGMGVLFLIGILPNSAILFTHFATYLRREKSFTRERAILVSGHTRMRPILMTVLTTILGILPMAFGDKQWVPFAMVVIGGLASSTILTLLVVPGFYFVVEDVAAVIKRGMVWLVGWRWLLFFWSKPRRTAIRGEYRETYQAPKPQGPLRIETHHLTRVYKPSVLERLSNEFRRYAFGSVSSIGFLPLSIQTPPKLPAKKALDGVSLTIEPGLFGLLGPNGAGKTTLLRLIAGIDEPSRGSICVSGFDMKTHRRHAQGMIGYLPQEFGVYGPMTAYQYLDYCALLKGIRNGGERRKAIVSALEQVNLTDQKNTPAGKLSGGMMRRLGLAQILIQPPQAIIVDEPTAGLDPLERVRFRNLLAAIARDRVVILSTHIVEDIANGCSRIALLNQGRIQFLGTPEELMESARGKVWEALAPNEAERRELRANSVVAGHSLTPEGFLMRLISDEPPSPEAECAPPSLEDAYLFHLRENGTKTMELEEKT